MKTFEVAFAIQAALGNRFQSTFSGAQGAFSKLTAESNRIKQSQSELTAEYKQGKIAVDEYNRKMADLQRSEQRVAEAERKLSQAVNTRQNAMSKFQNARAQTNMALVNVQKWTQPLQTAVGTAIEFEAAMSKVQAITNSDANSITKLTEQARELGSKTQFTARQSAEAMTYLGMAGWKTEEILKGMPGLLSLAAAGGEDLATTADIVSDDLTAFGLSADQAQRMADVFATTMTNTNTNIRMLGETMKYAAPVAKGFGASLEETSALAGLMANAGIKATQAGTALRAGFLRLAAPTKKGKEALDEMHVSLSEATKQRKEASSTLAKLGISTQNSNGTQRKTLAIIRELAEKTKKLGEQEKLAAFQRIFGTNAASAWMAVIDQGPGALEKLCSQLENSNGASARMADTMNDNARGAFTRFASATESLQISLGTMLLPTLTNLMNNVTGVVGVVDSFMQRHPGIMKALTAITAGVTGLYIALKAGALIQAGYNVVTSAFTVVAASYKVALLALELTHGKVTIAMKIATMAQAAFNAVMTANPVGLVIVAIAALIAIGIALYKNWEKISQFFATCWDAGKQALSNFCSYITEKFTAVFDWLTQKWNSIKSFFGAPIKGDVQVKAQEVANKQQKVMAVKQNATGGIYGKGAFLTTFAENSGESAIPHAPTERNVGLLARTNDIMGRPLGNNSITATFSPTINISSAGTDTAKEIKAALQSVMSDFEKRLADLQHQKARVSYA